MITAKIEKREKLVAVVKVIGTGVNTSDATADADDIRYGETAYVNGSKVTGSMADNGAVTKTLDSSTTSYTVPAGYHNGSGKVNISTETKTATPTTGSQTVTPSSGKVLSKVTVNAIPSQYVDTSDATATAANIQNGKTAYVNGEKITGTHVENSGLDTSDATATAGDILSGKTAYVNGSKVTGSIAAKSESDITASGKTVTVPAGYYASSADKSVETATQATPTISVDNSGKITATSEQSAGYVAAGTKRATKQLSTQAAQTITPGTTDKTIASGKYLTGKQTVKGDANLVPGNIKSGVSIFGVSGSYEGSGGIDTSDATATAYDIASGKTAYINGEKVTGTLGTLSSSAASLTSSDSSIDFTYNGTGKYIIEKGTKLYCDKSNFGDASAADVVAGKTFTSAAGLKVTGTHECAAGTPTLQSKTVAPSESEQTVSPDSGYDGLSSVTVEAVSNTYVGSGVTKRSAQSYTPGISDQIITSGQYLTGNQTIKGDANLVAGNIKSGVSIFGVSGSYEGSGGGFDITGDNLHNTTTDTDGIYLESGVEKPYNGWSATDFIPVSDGDYAVKSSKSTINGLYCPVYDADKNFIKNLTGYFGSLADNGYVYFSISGASYIRFSYKTSTINTFSMYRIQSGSGVGIDTSDATATADDMAEGVTAYANGEKLTGTISVGAPSSNGMGTPVHTKNELINAISIKATSKNDVLMRSGTEYGIMANASDFGNATAADVVSGKTFTSSAGLKVTGTHVCDGGTTPTLQSKTVTPSESEQTVSPDSGYDGLSSVTVESVSNTYVGSGVTKKAAQTITPGTADQTLAAGQYLSGAQTIKGDANLIPGNIRSGVSIFGVTGSHEGSSGGGSLVSKSGSTTTPSFDTGLSEIVAIIIDKDSVNSTGLTEASFVPILGKGTVSGCSSYNTYMKQYASKISTNSCNVEGGTFNWVDTNSTYAFKENNTYSWFAIGYE